jgi:hypothetical protein
MARGREYVQVGDASVDLLQAELAVLAAGFVLSGLGPDVDQAITVACELLVRDLDTPGTVAVASLAYGTPLRDARPVVLDMLREQGFSVPRPDAGGGDELIAVLRAVAAGGLQVSARGLCGRPGKAARSRANVQPPPPCQIRRSAGTPPASIRLPEKVFGIPAK